MDLICASSEETENDVESHVPDDFPAFPPPIPGKLAFSCSGLYSNVEWYLDRIGGVGKLDQAEKPGFSEYCVSAFGE